MAESQPLPEAPCGAEYSRAVLRSPVYEVAQVTPLQVMEKISSRLGNTILVKREDRSAGAQFQGARCLRDDCRSERRAESARRGDGVSR